MLARKLSSLIPARLTRSAQFGTISLLSTSLLLGCTSFINPKLTINVDKEKLAYRKQFISERIVPATRPPNIIVILADDLGKMDLKHYNNLYHTADGLTTPHIASIGKNGVTFKNAYITSPVCGPSRAGLITGRYQQRFGFEFLQMERYARNSFESKIANKQIKDSIFIPADIAQTGVPPAEAVLQQGLPLSEITLAEFLKKQGYRTGLIGKWHLSDFRTKAMAPRNRGFDYHYGFFGSHSLYTHKTKTHDVTNIRVPNEYTDDKIWATKRNHNSAIFKQDIKIKERDYLTYNIAKEANAFIDRNKEQPFFLYVTFNAPHTPLQALKTDYEKYKDQPDKFKRVYAALVDAMDKAVGEILATVEAKNLAEETVIFFLSDNGGALYTRTTDNGILRGGKFTQFEGGVSVPFMMQWKGKLPPNTLYTPSVSSVDIFTTVAAMTQAPLPSDRVYDGIDLYAHVMEQKTPERALFFRTYKNKALIHDHWKLMVNGWDNAQYLFNLQEDPSEEVNLNTKHPERVQELQTLLARYEKDIPFNPTWPRFLDSVYREGDKVHRFSF